MKRKLIVLAMFILLMLDAIPSAMAACSHKWMTESYTAPTCTSDGKSVQRCMVCGASKTSTSSKLGHNKKTNTTNASCSEAGKKVTYCTRAGCNYTKVETIPKVAHSFGKWTTKKAPTCFSTGIEKRICSVCSYEESRPITYKDPGNHSNLDKVVPTKPSTCTETGSGYRLCKACKEKVTVTIPKKAHDYGNWTTKKAPTCSSTGIEKRVCSVCNYEENRPITYKDPGNHSNLGDVEPTKDSTCTEIGSGYRVCTACKEKVTVKIPRKPHEYSNWTTKKAPTCSSTGIEKRVCSVCGDEENRPITYKDPGNHSNLGDLEIDYDSTCTEEGKGYRVCRACGEKVTVTIPTKPHEYGDWTTIIPPTCSSIGIKGRLCTECGEEAPDRQPITYLDPANHSSLGEWKTTKEPSCVEGEEKATCCVCGVTVTHSLDPNRDHSYGAWKISDIPSISGTPQSVRYCTCGKSQYGNLELALNTQQDYPPVSVSFEGTDYQIPTSDILYIENANGSQFPINFNNYQWTNGTNTSTTVATGESPKNGMNYMKAFGMMGLSTPGEDVTNPGEAVGSALVLFFQFFNDAYEEYSYLSVNLIENSNGAKTARISVNHISVSGAMLQGETTGYKPYSEGRKLPNGSYDDTLYVLQQSKQTGQVFLHDVYGDMEQTDIPVSNEQMNWLNDWIQENVKPTPTPTPTPTPAPTPTNAPKPPQVTPVPTPGPNSGMSRSLSLNEARGLPPESESTPESTPISEPTPEPSPIPEPATPTDLMPL